MTRAHGGEDEVGERLDSLAALRSAVAALDVSDPDMLHDLGNEFRAVGADIAAIAFFGEAIRRGVNDSIYNLGLLHLDRGDPDEALAYFEQAARAGDPKGAFMAGQRHEELGDLELAERWYRGGLEVDDTPFRLARVLRAQGCYEAAEELVASNAERSWECAVDLALGRGPDDVDAIALLERHFEAGVLEVGVTLEHLLAQRDEAERGRSFLERAAAGGELSAVHNQSPAT